MNGQRLDMPGSATPLGLRDRLAAAPPTARSRVLIEFILQQLRDELGIEGDELHPRSRFESLGVDSKRALEFKELLDEELHCTLRTTLLFDYPTPESLAAYVVRVAFGGPEGPEAATPAALSQNARPDEPAGRHNGPDGPPLSPDGLPLSPDGLPLSPDGPPLSIDEQLQRKLAKYDV